MKLQRRAGAAAAKSKRSNIVLKRALQWLAALCLAVIILLGVAILVAPHFGWRFDAVYSGSMEPEVCVGSMVVVRQVDPYTIRDGDVITFVSRVKSDSFVTHRVVEVMQNESALFFQTKGDANEDVDAYLVQVSDVIGRVRLSVPYAGYVADFIQKPLGFALVLGVPALIIVLIEVRNISVAARDLRRKNRQKKVYEAEADQESQ